LVSTWLATAAFVLAAAPAAEAQVLHLEQKQHLEVGLGLGIYPTEGGFGLGDQSFGYTGFHIDAARLGLSQRVTDSLRMEFVVLLGFSLLADPGYRGIDEAGEEGESNFGFHWGFGVGGYHKFPFGLTLGLGMELTFASGSFLDTMFFRAVPAVGYEWSDPLQDWFVHLRWANGITLLHGLEEANTDPASNLTITSLQLIYGF